MIKQMPELPDIQVYVEQLAERLVGQPLTAVTIAKPFVLRSVDPPIADAVGRRFTGIRRSGKRIVLVLDNASWHKTKRMPWEHIEVKYLPPYSPDYNPIEHLIGAHALGALSPANHAVVTGRSFFPHLISSPFSSGLHEAFLFAIIACLVAAVASWSRGGMPTAAGPIDRSSDESASQPASRATVTA